MASTAHRSGLAPNSIMLTCCQWESDGTDDDGDGHMLRGNGDRMLRCRLWLRWRSSLGSQSVGRRWLEATWSSHHILTMQPVCSLDSIEWFCVTGQMSRWEEEVSPSGLFRCTGSTGPGSDPAQMPDAPDADGKTCKDVKKCHTMVEGASPGIGSGCKVFLLLLLWPSNFFLPSTKPLHPTQQLRL